MRLQDPLSLFSNVPAGNTDNTSKQVQTGFETLLAEAERRNQTQVPETSTRTRDDSRQRSTTNETRANRSGQREERETRSNSNSTETNDVSANRPAESINTDNKEEIDETQAVAMIAAILQVPEEYVLEWLEELNLTVQDLTDPQVVTKVLQMALDAETTAQLLTNAEFPEIFKAINEAMAELVQEAEIQATVTAGTADVKTQAATLLEAETEGLQLINEDGELIVMEEATTEFASNENTSQNSSANSDATQNYTADTSQNTILDILQDEAQEILHDQPQISPSSISMTTAKAKVDAAIQQSTPTSNNVNAADVIEQIMDQVRVTSSGGNFTEMRLTLRPESLGDIMLRVITQNGIVTAMFEAESQRVKEVLESSFNQLRDALEEQGIQFSELSVSVRQEGNERMNQFEYARQMARRRMDRMMRTGEVEEEAPQPIAPRHNGVIDVTA